MLSAPAVMETRPARMPLVIATMSTCLPLVGRGHSDQSSNHSTGGASEGVGDSSKHGEGRVV